MMDRQRVARSFHSTYSFGVRGTGFRFVYRTPRPLLFVDRVVTTDNVEFVALVSAWLNQWINWESNDHMKKKEKERKKSSK